MGVTGGRGCVLRVLDGDVETFPVEGVVEVRREAARGMEVESRLAALEGRGIGVALGDRGGREEAVETELERVVERVKRVDASEGAREEGIQEERCW